MPFMPPASPLVAMLRFFSPGRASRGVCPRCERPTAWDTHAVYGTYRCTRCGTDPLHDVEA